MYEINYKKYIEFLKRFLHKLRPRFSFHYIAYTTLFFLVIFSVVQLVSATTPNPGHPWSEVGDGTFVVSGPSVSRTYTFPDANATVLTTNNAVTVAQGGTGLNSLGSANQILGINSGGSGMEYKTLTQGSNITITHGTGTVTIAANTGANALGTYITQTATNAPSNAQILGQLSTGILKNTTTTGVLSIATAGDFPTLNQNTTGTAGNISGGLGGQILYQSAVNVTSKLNNGDPGQVLTSNGATDAPSWTTIATSPITIVNSSNLFSTGLSGAGSSAGNVTDSIFFGLDAGNGADVANNSNFFGNSAGVLASKANNSNFFGNSAGASASDADNSNFFGNLAGDHAGLASSSNFFGYSAGKDATEANNSNFFGNSAGELASSSSNSNFFGYSAGYNANGANNSNFFGQYAGYSATDASYSNFFGQDSGGLATYAALSNFFGYSAGNGATNAAYSNFIGNSAGYAATDAVYSNFIGNSAGDGATNAAYSSLIGYKAGKSFTGNNIGSNNIIIGTNVSLPDGVADSINLGGVLFATGTYSDISGDASITGIATGKMGIGVVSPTQIISLNGTAARTIWMERNITAATAGQGLTLSSGGAIAGTNNLAGGDLNLKSGISTGTGTSSLRFFTAKAGLSGSTDNTPSEKMTILGSGNVGIGNITPGYLLHVGSSSVTDSTVLLRLEDSNSTCDFNANTGAPSCGSDITLKKNINDQSDNLSKIIALRPVTYNWLTDPDGVDVKHGFIAQEVAEVMPELVTNGTWVDGSTRKFLQTAGMTPYIVGAIKEMNLKLENINNLDEPNSFRDNIMAWLSNAGNRIARIFTGEVCLTEVGEETVCLNRAELKSLKELINQSTVSTTDITSDEGANNVTATCSDGIMNQDETSVDSGGVCDTSSVLTDDGSSSESVVDKNIEKLAPEPEIAPVIESVSN